MNRYIKSHGAAFLADCERIHRLWHDHARAQDTEALLTLYASEALLESPLVQAILDDWPNGLLRGHEQLRRFFSEGARRRPNELVRWHRPDSWQTDGEHVLVWEYPRATPDGDQVDICEVMDIADGLIQRHRIYWGWFGSAMLTRNAVTKATRSQP